MGALNDGRSNHQSRNVKWEDNFHLKLIDNVLSQTELVIFILFE